MIHSTLVRLCAVALLGLAVGCGDNDHDPDGGSMPGAEDHAGHDHGEHMDEGSGDGPFAALGAEDAKLAKEQGICPVSGEKLGSMGTPVKVMVRDRPVFLCCESCRKDLLSDPDKYLAKLDK